jgi:hypothetical protein
MKQNFTSINIMADASGSMGSLAKETISGLNKFIKEQKEVDGTATLTLCVFDDHQKFVYNCEPLENVKEITDQDYVIGGWTGLLDAMGAVITATEEKIAAMHDDDRPEKVIFLTITDGEENASKKYTLPLIKEMVELKGKKGYHFIFTGANIDSFKVGGNLGLKGGASINYQATERGTKALYDCVSRNMTRYRSMKLSDMGDSSQIESNFFETKLEDVTPAVVSTTDDAPAVATNS